MPSTEHSGGSVTRVTCMCVSNFLISPYHDPSWFLIEEGIDLAREREIESILTTANGYLGVGLLSPRGRHSRVLRSLSPATMLQMRVLDRDLRYSRIGCVSKLSSRAGNYRCRLVRCWSTGGCLICVRAFYFASGGSRIRADVSPG